MGFDSVYKQELVRGQQGLCIAIPMARVGSGRICAVGLSEIQLPERSLALGCRAAEEKQIGLANAVCVVLEST